MTPNDRLPIRTSAALLALSLFAGAASAQTVTKTDDPLAINPALPDLVNGQAAIERIGDRIEEYARGAGITVAAFAERLLADPNIYADPSGNLVAVDPWTVHEEYVEQPLQRGNEPEIPTSEAFKLHSRPGSNYTIYLDFDGHHSVNNSWGHNIQFPPFDRNGNPSAFTENELREIIDHWRYIAEDYAPFDIDVTTEDPGLEALRKSGGGDTQWGVRDVHTQATAGFGNGIGGVAFLWSFNDSVDNPVFSFNKGGNNGGMTGSHETGHALGLSHDGLNGQSYHPGASYNGLSWGPIMGAPFGADVVQWSAGEYTGATNTEHDTQIITDPANGPTLLPDDHGNDILSATPFAGACPTPNYVELCGVITHRSDYDTFSFSTSGGQLDVLAKPIDDVGNTDLWVKLFDSNGVEVASNNTGARQTANITPVIPAGDYTLWVDGGSQPNLYTDYGSRGAYTLFVTLPGPTSDFQGLGQALAGATGTPKISGYGFACSGATVGVSLSKAAPSSLGFLCYSASRADLPWFGGTLVPDVFGVGGYLVRVTSGTGTDDISAPWPAGLASGAKLYFQYWIQDAGGPQGYAASNAIVITVP